LWEEISGSLAVLLSEEIFAILTIASWFLIFANAIQFKNFAKLKDS